MPAGLALALLLAAADVPAPIRIEPADLGPGSPFVVRVASPDATRVTGTVFDRPLTFVEDNGEWTAIGGVDLDDPVGEATLKVTIERRAGRKQAATSTLKIAPRDYPTEHLTVEEKYVEPPPEVSERIARETALLNETYARIRPERLDGGRVTQPLPGVEGRNFGRRRVFNNQPRSPHTGADLSAPTGTPVRAAAAGRVVLAQELYFSGNLIVIDHGRGVFTQYAHLSAFEVAVGAPVEAGDVIGRVGATGRVTGAHLHFGARVGAARVEPFALLQLLQAAPAAVCTCAAAAITNGWCEAHGVGQVGGIRIPSQLLFEALDAHGHDVDVSTFDCASCRAAIATSGFCAAHRLGFVKGQAYFSRLTYELARADIRDPAGIACPVCRRNSETWGWCDAHAVGMMGRFAAADRAGYEHAAAAAEILRRAIAELPRCELCAVAMVTDSQCPRCRITYKDGRPLS